LHLEAACASIATGALVAACAHRCKGPDSPLPGLSPGLRFSWSRKPGPSAP